MAQYISVWVNCVLYVCTFIIIQMPKRIDSNDKISTSFKLPKALHTEVKVAAAREEREMSDVVEEALRAYLKNRVSR